MANTISAVTATFGTALRRRSMCVENPAGNKAGMTAQALKLSISSHRALYCDL